MLICQMDTTQSILLLPNLNITVACSAHDDKPHPSHCTPLFITPLTTPPKCWHLELAPTAVRSSTWDQMHLTDAQQKNLRCVTRYRGASGKESIQKSFNTFFPLNKLVSVITSSQSNMVVHTYDVVVQFELRAR